MGCKQTKERPQPSQKPAASSLPAQTQPITSTAPMTSSSVAAGRKKPEDAVTTDHSELTAGGHNKLSATIGGGTATANEPRTMEHKSDTLAPDAEQTAVTTQQPLSQDLTTDPNTDDASRLTTAATRPSAAAVTSSSATSIITWTIPPNAEKCLCHHVYDGDTLTLMDERRVRFLGIDTPELKEKQPFAHEAAEFTKAMIRKNSTVWLEFDGQEKDHYGRLLAYVYIVEEGSNTVKLANWEILHAGLARWYHPGESKLRYESEFRSASTAARKAKRGQWVAFEPRNVVATSRGKAYHVESCKHIAQIRNLRQLDEHAALDEGLSSCRECFA